MDQRSANDLAIQFAKDVDVRKAKARKKIEVVGEEGLKFDSNVNVLHRSVEQNAPLKFKGIFCRAPHRCRSANDAVGVLS